MTVQTLIYAYFAICVSMIVFNCVCVIVFRRRDKRLTHRSGDLEQRLREQLQRLGEGGDVEEAHMDYLYKKLTHVGDLLAFDAALDLLRKETEDGAVIRQYTARIHQVFVYLAASLKKDDIRRAHFAYLVAKYRIIEDRPVDYIMDVMLSMASSSNIYCRENALMAIYSSGDTGSVLKALRSINDHGIFHHSKLLTDGLLTFRGSHDTLIRRLLDQLPSFSVPMQVSLLNYIRFCSGGYRKEMLALLQDEKTDHEVRFCCIRYLGRYPYGEAYPLLLHFMHTSPQRRWEYAAVTSSALASYPTEASKAALKTALCDTNWYIRYNASDSLLKLNVPYEELTDILDGHDRFAREILQYRLDHARSREAAAAKAKEALSC